MKIIDNVFEVPSVVANPYLIVDADGLPVIDAGPPRSEKKILTYVSSLGKRAEDIKRIMITNADLDHFGGLPALQAASGARTYASRIEADAIARWRRGAYTWSYLFVCICSWRVVLRRFDDIQSKCLRRLASWYHMG